VQQNGNDGGIGDYVEGHIAFLKTELKINDVQMPQWTAFADALRLNATRMSEMQNTMMQGGMMGSAWIMSAPDRLDRMEKVMTAMIKMMTAMMESEKTTKSALTPLYGVLTDEQKKVADQLVQRSYVPGLW
jgi:hypothetical protein